MFILSIIYFWQITSQNGGELQTRRWPKQGFCNNEQSIFVCIWFFTENTQWPLLSHWSRKTKTGQYLLMSCRDANSPSVHKVAVAAEHTRGGIWRFWWIPHSRRNSEGRWPRSLSGRSFCSGRNLQGELVGLAGLASLAANDTLRWANQWLLGLQFWKHRADVSVCKSP